MIQIGNFTYSKDENGSWIYKANDDSSNKEAAPAKNNIIEIAKYLKENLL
jgi:hypothetical protein